MKRILLFLFSLPICAVAQINQAPILSNLTLVDYTAKTITIRYDVADAENDLMTINGFVFDSISKKTVNIIGASGDIGTKISAGKSKEFTWDYSASLPKLSIFNIKVVADDGKVPSIDAIVQQVNCERMISDLAFLAKKSRQRTANPAHLEASRDTIQKILAKAFGESPNVLNFAAGSYTGKNIVSTKKGLVQAQKSYIIDAHYDSVSEAPGADDNGSGTVGVLEAARILSQYNFKKTLRFAAFDMEEDGLLGSKAYAKNLTPNDIEGVLNFEMIGFYDEKPNAQTLPTGFNQLFPQAYNAVKQDSFRGNFITNVGNVPSSDLILAFNEAAAKYVPALKIVSVAVPGMGTVAPDLRRSDHASFWDKNIKALMLTDGANFRNKNYHAASDTLGSINKAFLCNVVKATIATAATLAELDHSGQANLFVDKSVATKDIVPNCDFGVSPNPAKDELSIQFNNCASPLQFIDIVDITGKIVLKKTFSESVENTTIDIRLLAKGIYVLRTNEGAKTFVKE